ncbi:hypothetical protein NLG97_g11027 [Lecanicillium saksenae]|uniref:Uncharacterized protein n=1 Tax=Lecanicillium saksenae TaxID=468837 RepID=A0ACC1QCV1_9HYPO|nr:hypothetical protein NLG97_g11027 [Lecanicillium saksenae]
MFLHLPNPLTPHHRIRFSSSQQLAADAALAAATSYAVTDERFIRELMREDFSSPSTYPSFTNPPSNQDEDEDDFEDDDFEDDIYQDDSPHAASATTQASDCMGPANNATADVPDSPSQQLQAGPSANTTQNTDFSLLDTQHTDLIEDQGTTETAATSFSENMPVTTRRGATGILPPAKRQRGSQTERPSQTKQEVLPLAPDEDLFGDVPPVPAVKADSIADEDLTTIDLTDATEVPAELKKPIVDNRIKISAFQCAICMDDVTGLTVTYCGHLFCAQCLHHSLDVESTKGKCPMCRAKIDMKHRESYSSKTKGFWPLELKLMTTTRKGKRKADDISK